MSQQLKGAKNNRITAHDIPQELRVEDKFHHIDMGFLNRRLCITALLPEARRYFREHQIPENDHMTVLNNDHLLVTTLLDCYEALGAPTLLEALAFGKPRQLFRSTERLEPCPDVYDAERVSHDVELDCDFGKPVVITYHTKHIVSDTGKMVLAKGSCEGNMSSIVGLLHDKQDRFEIEPLVIGAPWFDHPRNGRDAHTLMWFGGSFGEIFPEDIDQFSRMRDVETGSTNEWMEVMRVFPEADVKKAIASLLSEPIKKDWGGESDDHFSGNVSVRGHRRSAAFLLKGPSRFRELTLEMCGKRADQIHRMVDAGAEVCVVQHAHMIGAIVRRTLRTLTVRPGSSRRKYCLIDGQATYRILKAYSFCPNQPVTR